MSALLVGGPASWWPRALLGSVLLAATPASMAQVEPASSGSAPHAADDGMAPMDHATMRMRPAPAATPETQPCADRGRGGTACLRPSTTHPGAAVPGQPATTRPPDPGTTEGMPVDAPQSAGAPPDARSADYSDGVGYGSRVPEMAGDHALGKVLLEQLEVFHGRDGNGQALEAEGWYGHDLDKLWLRSNLERSGQRIQSGDLEAFWNHAVAPYWSTQLGVRHELDDGPRRDWVAVGVEGLAPYWFELQATAYLGPAGRTAARLRVDYALAFTQRLILQPALELDLYGSSDPARGIGSGLSEARFGWRLRYEMRREIAPYVGLDRVQRWGTTAAYARAEGQHAGDTRFVAGIRLWF